MTLTIACGKLLLPQPDCSAIATHCRSWCNLSRGDKSSPVRREAATSLGRIGNAEAIPALLSRLAGVTDRFLDHALIFALIRLDNREQTVAGLNDRSPEVRRGR